MTTTHEHKLARALVAAHVPEEVVDVVLDAIDGWHEVIEEAERAIERAALVDVDRRTHLLHRTPTSLAHRNASKTHCPHGHPYTPENTIVRPQGAGRPGVGRFCRTCATYKPKETS